MAKEVGNVRRPEHHGERRPVVSFLGRAELNAGDAAKLLQVRVDAGKEVDIADRSHPDIEDVTAQNPICQGRQRLLDRSRLFDDVPEAPKAIGTDDVPLMPVGIIKRAVARGRPLPPSLRAPIVLQHLTCFPVDALGIDQRIVIDEGPGEHILTRNGPCHLDDACVA